MISSKWWSSKPNHRQRYATSGQVTRGVAWLALGTSRDIHIPWRPGLIGAHVPPCPSCAPLPDLATSAPPLHLQLTDAVAPPARRESRQRPLPSPSFIRDGSSSRASLLSPAPFALRRSRARAAVRPRRRIRACPFCSGGCNRVSPQPPCLHRHLLPPRSRTNDTASCRARLPPS